MTLSRIAAAILVLVAAVWIGSGVLGRDRPEPGAQQAQPVAVEKTRFKVAVLPVTVEQHARNIVISGRTEADRRATAIARAAGIIVDLRVRRGNVVKTGDVIAVLSDEAREAMVDQAKARLDQRRAELTARLQLIEKGNMPAINRSQLEAEMKAAEALLAQAEAERRKGEVLAPVSGVVNDVPTELGQAMQANATVAEVIALDPMLAVVEVSERQLGGVKLREHANVKLVTGETAVGRVRFVSRKASPQTRTYRVEVRIDNPEATIPDGVTCEVSLPLAAVAAARLPRSALSFSAEGKLGVRTVDGDGRVAFVPVAVMEDGPQVIWVAGVEDGAKVIVQGQEFVKEGELVEAVPFSLALLNGK
jgi:multidrug efflux system membrane fusion protein